MEGKKSNQQNPYGLIGWNDPPSIESIEPAKCPYPKRIFLILGDEFCERFTYYGMTAILVLYLNEKLGYSENDASALYHGFTMMVYFLCIIGGVISDVWLGKFKTIFYLSMVYVIGCVAVSSSASPFIGISPKIVLIFGLLLIAIGSGGIKPCVSAFGGDQFKIPQQADQLAMFFSLYYFSVNLGSVISTVLTPALRSDVQCFGENDCYSLAFGVPAILMIAAITFFVVGKSSYTMAEISSENMVIQVMKCISNAIITKFCEGQRNPRKNLLDYSIDKYGQELVDDVRTLLRILVLYLPLPMFWTLNAQSGSRWTFQAKQMNGDIGFYHLKPDQMQMINPFLILFLIPLFETVIYPFLKRFGLRRPLQKMTIGGVLTAIAFILAGIVQLQIEAAPEHTVHMLWQFPQYFVLTVGELMFSIVGLGFSYEEAPKAIKSIVISFWQLTVAIGNLITLVLISSVHIFEYRSHEFLFFAGLMFADMLVFITVAHFYKSTSRAKAEQI